MPLHSEYTRLRLGHEPEDGPGIALNINAHPAEYGMPPVVSLYLGSAGAGQYSLHLALRGARELAMLLQSFANIAEGIEPPPVPEAVDPRADKCEQLILSENRYCEQLAVHHDENRQQAYCEAHAAAWAKWRGDEPIDPLVHASAIEGTPYADSEVVEDPAQGSYPDPDAEGKV